MAKIFDRGESKAVRYGDYICVWEVFTYEFDDDSCESVEVRKAVFFDPNKAMAWAIKNFGMLGKVQASLFKADWCV